MVKQRKLEELKNQYLLKLVNKTYLFTNGSSLQATSSEWSLGITTRYIYIKLTVLNDNYDDISTTLRERKLTGDSSKVILEKRKRHRTNISVKNGF